MKKKLVWWPKNEGSTPELLDAANRRVFAHLDNLAMIDFDLRQLAMNCYLQGVWDAAISLDERQHRAEL
jgi:hypothetical protein